MSPKNTTEKLVETEHFSFYSDKLNLILTITDFWTKTRKFQVNRMKYFDQKIEVFVFLSYVEIEENDL